MKLLSRTLILCSAVLVVFAYVDQTNLFGQAKAPPQKAKIIKQPVQQRAQPRATSQSSHTLEEIAPVRATVMRVLPVSEWTTKNHNGAPWDTTSNPRDLDNDVRLGAHILKFDDGQYVQTVHKQYPSSCGPASLAMTLKQLGIAHAESRLPFRPGEPRRKPSGHRAYPVKRDVDNEGDETVNVGYRGSMEHLMWLGYRRHRMGLDMTSWNAGNNQFMTTAGVLNTADSSQPVSFLESGNDMDYLSTAMIPAWLWNGPAVGCGGSSSYYTGLPGIMNYIFSGDRNGPWRDARPLYLNGNNDAEVVAARRVIKGFIDHNISVVCGVDSGGHFNTVIGYRGDVSPASADFWVYTADPLNGWGRSEERQPGTWRRMLVNQQSLNGDSGLFMAMIVWNQHAAGNASVNFRPDNWAQEVDRLNGNNWLTGSTWRPHDRDPLNDSEAQTADRMP
ncbi:MAG: hypothetical protein KDA86_19590 [Planctomycetaceae bacterium]|nr:hypothetical protein [Planctomycetaceae bacterium]